MILVAADAGEASLSISPSTMVLIQSARILFRVNTVSIRPLYI